MTLPVLVPSTAVFIFGSRGQIQMLFTAKQKILRQPGEQILGMSVGGL